MVSQIYKPSPTATADFGRVIKCHPFVRFGTVGITHDRIGLKMGRGRTEKYQKCLLLMYSGTLREVTFPTDITGWEKAGGPSRLPSVRHERSQIKVNNS